MRWMIKTLGMVLVLFSSFLLSLYKTKSINSRIKFLEEFYINASEFKEKIVFGMDDVSVLLEECFSDKIFIRNDNSIVISTDCLNTDDIKALNGFFLNIGSRYGDEEYRRIDIQLKLLADHIETIKKQSVDTIKLWKTVCLSFGGIICILLF